MSFEFNRHRTDKIPREEVLAALERAAQHFRFKVFTKRQFNTGHFGASATTVQNTFGSWHKGIDALRRSLQSKNLVLAPASRVLIPEDQLFNEMERIWRKLGHRPSRDEWEAQSPRYHYGTYKNRFGGWRAACLAFIEHRMGSQIQTTSHPDSPQPLPIFAARSTQRSRQPPLRLRLRVLERDGFRCVLCGRSPATERGTVLHLDHIVPFATGGSTTFENLRTLCDRCNLGRGASDISTGA